MAVNQLKSGVILNYITLALNNLIGLLFTPYLLRMLGQTQYGLYSLAASVIAYLTLLDMGFGNAIVRYTARFRAQGKTEEQKSLFGMFIIVYSGIGLLSFAIGLAVYFNIDALFDATMSAGELRIVRIILLLMLVNLAVTFPLGIFGSILTAYERFVFPKIVNVLRIVLNTLVMIFLLGMGYKAIALVVVQTVFNIATLLINAWYCFREVRVKFSFGRWNTALFRDIVYYSFWILLYGVTDRLYWSSGQFILGATEGAVAIAIFALAVQLKIMYTSFSGSFSNIFLPRVTAMIAHNCSHSEVSDLFIRIGRLQFAVLSFILTGFIVFGRQFISLWSGPDYLPSYPVALVMFIAVSIMCIQEIGNSIIEARKKMKFRSVMFVVAGIVSVVAQIFLSERFGAMGCAIGLGAAIVIGPGIILNIYYSRSQHIDTLRFWTEILKMSVAPAVLAAAGCFLSSVYPPCNWLQLGIEIALYSIIYIPASYYFCMNDYEKSLLRAALRRIQIFR